MNYSYVMTKAEEREFKAWHKRHPQSKSIPLNAVKEFYVRMILKPQHKVTGGIIRPKGDLVATRIRNKLKKLQAKINNGYHGGRAGQEYISGHDIARWEAQVEVLQELLEWLEND